MVAYIDVGPLFSGLCSCFFDVFVASLVRRFLLLSNLDESC